MALILKKSKGHFNYFYQLIVKIIKFFTHYSYSPFNPDKLQFPSKKYQYVDCKEIAMPKRMTSQIQNV
jgi:hypothetical protein